MTKLYQVIAERLGIEQVDDSTALDNVDSLSMLDLAVTVQFEFSVAIPDEELPRMKTVGDLRRYLERRVACA